MTLAPEFFVKLFAGSAVINNGLIIIIFYNGDSRENFNGCSMHLDRCKEGVALHTISEAFENDIAVQINKLVLKRRFCIFEKWLKSDKG